MNLTLERLAMSDEGEFRAMLAEFHEADGSIYPGVLKAYTGDFPAYLALLSDRSAGVNLPKGYMPSDAYWLKDARGRLLGACDIRHRLSENLLASGGHIGYGIRPSERRKGLGTTQLQLALAKAKALGIERALVVCDKDNPASACVILNNGGVLEDERTDADGNAIQRYWVATSNAPVAIRRARMGDEVAIRPLQEEIARLHFEGRPDLFRSEARYFSEESFRQRLESPEHFVWIAVEPDGTAVGYAFANAIRYRGHSTYRDFDSFYVADICVLERCRKRGIGRSLFDACERQARALRCHNIDLGVYGFNEDAIAFYEHVGMKERMRRMEYRLDQPR